MWSVYALRCEGDRLYVGITQNLDDRFLYHARGEGSLFTRAHRPEKLIWFEEHPDLASARQRERQLKGWTRRKKEALFRGDLKALKKRRPT